VKPLLISPITSPQLLRICISNLRDDVLLEKLMDLPELFSEVWFFVLRIAVGLLELCQSSFREFGPATRINEPRADFTSTPRANGFMREHSVLQPHEISASVEPMGRFGCAEVANLSTRRRIKDGNLPCHPLSLRLFSGQCSLEFRGWYTCLGTLGPRHSWSTFTVDKNELLSRGPSGEFEQPDAFGAILADNALRQRLSRTLSRLWILLNLSTGASLSSRTHLASLFVCHDPSCCCTSSTQLEVLYLLREKSKVESFVKS
jgi:hypothetical protein